MGCRPCNGADNPENIAVCHRTSYTLVVVPMFILMGLVVSSAGIVTNLYDSIYRWLSRFRGSMLMVATAASAVFGAVSGSTVFTHIALPEMVRLGYKPGVAAAAIGAAGTLASLIPPSIAFVIYAIITGNPSADCCSPGG